MRVRLLRLKTILVATDLSETSDPAVDTAGRLAGASGAALHVVHVAADPAAIIGHTAQHAECVQRLDAAMRRAGVEPSRAHAHVLSGDPPSAISSLAQRIGAGLTILGRHRAETRLLGGRPLGSAAYAVVTRTTTPCLVVRSAMTLPLRRALVAIDFSEAARGALLVALSWASALRSRAAGDAAPALTALHVKGTQNPAPRGPESEGWVDEELGRLRDFSGGWAGVSVQGTTQASDDPVGTIVDFAIRSNVGIVVLGTRGQIGDGRSELGSISAAVTLRLDIPVLLVPPSLWREYGKDLEARSGAHVTGPRTADVGRRGFEQPAG